MNMQESVTTKERTQDENADELEVSLQKAEDHGGDAVPNPLEKYMKMVQQNQEQEIANKTSKKEDVDISSERLPGSEREDSFSAAGSLQGEPDEDFW
uniref:Uncharacterized protein n=2 Tax=Sphaerodactylus townsendi TaxID=933632 RepID=A0ACB8FIH0_9SAUR